ncbi:MAG TPA: alcohol dehydrogenase catalytic domain-containing protein [Armatimonadota bacterium]|jgi:threonine dehydrogenase-like Zn-dependent dehydrogenase
MGDMVQCPVFVGGGRIEYIERPAPIPGPGELLIRVEANALCGSERGQFYDGCRTTPGHEAAGVVTAVGEGATVPVGTHGVVFLMVYCGECRNCRQGFTNQCLNKQGDMGFSRDGGYGPYEIVPERLFFPTGPDLYGAEATLLLDIVGTGSHAIERGRLVQPLVESVLVMGAGPIGLGVLAMCRIVLGHEVPVHITDVASYRLSLAEELGGIPVDLRSRTVESALSSHAAPDLAIDTSGKQAARQSAFEAVAKRGILVCVGHGEGLSLDVSSQLIGPERAVLGSEYFRFNEMPANLERLRANREYLSRIITHRFPVERLEEAFTTFFAGQTGKVVVEQ